MVDLVRGRKGQRMFLLANHAIARGAMEAGVSVATTYPGTPSSEIGEALAQNAHRVGMYFEYSVNEKVALETASAAAVSGLRAFTFYKHVGMNVAADAFMTYAYTGVVGGHVVVIADDPYAHSSQNEQDTRYYAQLSGCPMLEPSTPQEAKDFLVAGYALSEELQLPVIVRTTTRVNHVSGPVVLGSLKKPKGKGRFRKEPMRFVPVPLVARIRHRALMEACRRAEVMADRSPFNVIRGDRSSKVGIIASGACYLYVMEALKSLNLRAKVLKLGMTHPVPRKKIVRFLKTVEKVLVVEELEPYMENAVKAAAQDAGINLKVHGKDFLPRMLEFSQDHVNAAVARLFGRRYRVHATEEMELPPRPPNLCPGCPHRATYYEVKTATKDSAVYVSDIGCYTLGLLEPLKTADFFLCMGSSSGIAGGFSKAVDDPVVAFVGDSTFYHSAVPGVINGVHNRHRFLYVILDNRTTAMTGHQPHPGMDRNAQGEPAPEVPLEDVLRGCGIKHVKTIDPFDVKASVETLREMLKHEEPAAVISKRECALLELARKRKAGEKVVPFAVDHEKCVNCRICITRFACTAFFVDDATGKPQIDPNLCVGCTVCAQICPVGAIGEVRK